MIKRLFSKAKESNTSTDLTLLEYRNTPISGIGLSPAQLLMSRRLRSNLLMTKSLLSPQVNEKVKDNLEMRQQKQVQYYNRGARPLPPLSQGDVVRYRTGSKRRPGVVIGKHTRPRSYNIRTPSGNILHRNRRHIKRTSESSPELDYSDYDDEIPDDPQELLPSSDTADQSRSNESSEAPTQRVSKYGRPIKVLLRYRDINDT